MYTYPISVYNDKYVYPVLVLGFVLGRCLYCRVHTRQCHMSIGCLKLDGSVLYSLHIMNVYIIILYIAAGIAWYLHNMLAHNSF